MLRKASVCPGALWSCFSYIDLCRYVSDERRNRIRLEQSDHNKFPFFDKDGNPRRDIRLYETVAVNGDKFKGAQKVQIYEGATQAPYKDGRMSYNGVAMRKFIRNFNDEVNGKFYSCPLIRLPEVYLNILKR